MTSDKRPTSSNKRARSRRKQRAVLRAATRISASPPTPEGEDNNSNNNNIKSEKTTDTQEPLVLIKTNNSSSSSISSSDDVLDVGLVFVCRPTLPDFCSLFVPLDDVQSVTRVAAASTAVTCKAFTVRVPSFRETREGFVTYTLELITCDLPQQMFQLERRFAEFVACAAELIKPQQLQLITSEEEEKKRDREGDVLMGFFQWHLPAKTWFRVTNVKALEDRRVQLEQALETLLRQRDGRMCNLPVVRDFLMLDIFGVQVAEQKTLETAAQAKG